MKLVNPISKISSRI